MNYGLHLSASGVLTNMYRQDVLANNLANVSTVGFKRDLASISQRAAETSEDHETHPYQHDILDKIGGGVLAGPQRISFDVGPLQQTGNALDLALENSDAFFVIAKPGENGKEELRFSRDGRFTRNAEGMLVTSVGGFKVMDADNSPIRISDDQSVFVSNDGRVQQGGVEVAQIQVATVRNREQLAKDGQNLLRYLGRAEDRIPADRPRVRSGFVEASAVDPIRELLGLIETSGAIQNNTNMIKYHDLMMDRAVNSLGRVTA